MRAPPAFQVYASDDLANADYYLLSLAERGLLDAMRRAAWVHRVGEVPRDPAQLATVVRRPEAEVRAALTPAVLRWFKVSASLSLVDPDLQRQHSEMMARREKQRVSAEVTNRRLGRSSPGAPKTVTGTVTDAVTGTVTDAVTDTVLRREEQKRNPSLGRAISRTDVVDEWVDAYKAGEPNFAKVRGSKQ